jgi:hypothetical protein
VKPACREFRRRLARALSGRAQVPALGALAWHEHLLGCADCRALLAAEEVLEALLASLPEPALPPDLARRVLARLDLARAEQALDELLAIDRLEELAAPAELASGVLAALQPEREALRAERALDRLLDGQPAPRVPAGLAQRVLARLAPRRRSERRRASARRVAPWLAAAGLAASAWGAWQRWAAPEGPRGAPPAPVAAGAAVPEAGADVPAELLAALDLLESWEVLTADDPDLALAALDEVDLLLLELEAEGS